MYTPRHFAMGDAEEIGRFVQAHGFGLLISAHPTIRATALPMMLTPDHQSVLGHMARANPQWEGLEGEPVLAVFSGPDAYISPRWYGDVPSVPTWNYLAVQISGVYHPLEGDALRVMMQDLLHQYESDSPIADHLKDPFYRTEMEGIVGFRIEVSAIEGKKKLNQNRSKEERQGVVRALSSSDHPKDKEVGRLMEDMLRDLD